MKITNALLMGLLGGLVLLAGCVRTNNVVPPAQEPPSSITQPGTQGDSATPQTDAQKVLLENIMQKAREGKVVNCEFPVKATALENVQAKWGEPDRVDYIPEAKGSYATYSVHQVAFGFNKGMQIFEVRSSDNIIKNLSLSKVQEVLGKPALERTVNNQDIVGYVVNQDFNLEFVFLHASQENPDPHVDHMNVLYPAGTVNSMADDPGREW